MDLLQGGLVPRRLLVEYLSFDTDQNDQTPALESGGLSRIGDAAPMAEPLGSGLKFCDACFQLVDRHRPSLTTR